MLSIQGVRKSFGGLQVLQGCTFDAQPGQITGLLGGNGAGKTTLFNILSGAIPADDGQLLYKDYDFTGLSQGSRIALGIGRTFQEVRLFLDMSVWDNVAIAVPEQPRERLIRSLLQRGEHEAERVRMSNIVQACLEFVGVSKDEYLLPARELSFGQQKLVSVARLLALDVKVYLFDEPASGLDGEALNTLRTVLLSLRDQGRTIVLVEHNALFMREICDEIVYLEAGQIIARGPVTQVMADPVVQARYLGVAATPAHPKEAQR